MAQYKVIVLYDFVPNHEAELQVSVNEELTVLNDYADDDWWQVINSKGETGIVPATYLKKIDSLTSNSPVDDDDDFDTDDEDEQTGQSGGSSSSRLSVINLDSKRNIKIVRSDNVVSKWHNPESPFTVSLSSPTISSKMGGLKMFVDFKLTPSFTTVATCRRYKQFDWLYNRMRQKFVCIAIPPLPEKQMTGRYEENFIDIRKAQLQEFANYICHHPVLRNSFLWYNFISVTNKDHWKTFKRKAEKDLVVGDNFYINVETPARELLQSVVKEQIFNNILYFENVSSTFKGAMNIIWDHQKKCRTEIPKNYTKIGDTFYALGCAFEASQKGLFSKSSVDVKYVATIYLQMDKIYEQQISAQWQDLWNKFYVQKNIADELSSILASQKILEQKKKECEKTATNHTELSEIRKRVDNFTYCALAELNHYETINQNQFLLSLKKFTQDQIATYKQLVAKLESAVQKIDSLDNIPTIYK